MNKAVFLDRDGTVIVDKGYLADPSQVVVPPGVVEALCELRKSGYMLIIISNQSGIGRGIFDENDMQRINERMQEIFHEHGVEFDDIFFCPHAPEDNCECRKPSPELLLDAMKKYDIDPSSSVMIGDKLSDAEAGIAAGCGCNIFLNTGKQPPPSDPRIPIADSLLAALDIIL